MSRKIWDFHGGIHPPENKSLSTERAIAQAPLPSKLVLPLQQHAGQRAKPLVAIGDKVLKGQQIASPEGYVSVAIHAPTSGTVIDIGSQPIPHPSGLTDLAIVIEPDGKDAWAPLPAPMDYLHTEPADVLQRIKEAGIAGLGGAGFPTAVKLNPSAENTITTLILNAVECEPYITADDMLLRERAEQVIQGIQIIAHILQPRECLIGIEDNKPEAIAAITQSLKALGLEQQIQLVVVPTKYPSGGEKQLIHLLTGKEVPHGGIPADIGIVCQNVGTACAVYKAVNLGQPLISRITTLTGRALARPGNLEVLLGTPIRELLSHCQVDEQQLNRLIMGGPMMGFTLTDQHLPIIKSTNCILASTSEELPAPAPEQACIRCGMCAEACPATLLPQQLYWYAKAKEFDKAVNYNLLDCIECGACSYVCPSNIPLVQYYRFAKGEIRKEEHEHTRSEHSRQRFEARQARLDREAAEKAAKRAARAKAAAASQEKKRKSAAASDQGKGVKDQPVDEKAAVIQAALERVQAKKATKDKPPVQPEQDEKETLTDDIKGD